MLEWLSSLCLVFGLGEYAILNANLLIKVIKVAQEIAQLGIWSRLEEKLMAHPHKSTLEKSKDIRMAVTEKIWGFATGMLAICIPLSAVTKSGPIIPIAVISGAAVGTASVWKFSEQKSASRIEASAQLKSLEGRIADLETIIATGDMDWQRRIPPTATSTRSPQALPESPHS